MATGKPKTTWKGTLTPDVAPLVDPALTLTYAGKAAEAAILATPAVHPLELWQGQPSAVNRLYFGDNLALLAHLLQDSRIKGQVKLIYIDPPFATNSVFHSRTQADAYQDLLLGAPYVEFLRKRLILLRELLADDGSIYLHLDDNMVFHMKLIMDEIFGPKNFRNCITRRKCSHKNFTRKTYGNISDYILFYSKTATYVWNRSMEAWTAERSKKEYPCIDQGTGKRYKKVPIHAPGTRNGTTGTAWRGMLPPPGKHWQYPPTVLDEMERRGEIYWSPTGNPRRKLYFEASTGVAVQDIWYDCRDDRNQNVHSTGYPTEKNPEVLRRILRASSNPGDLVLDCFAGSGTTLAMAAELGRQWIGIDNSVEAFKATLQRLVHGVARMGDYGAHGTKNGTDHPCQASMLAVLTNEASDLEANRPSTVQDFTILSEAADQAAIIGVLRQFLPIEHD